MQIPGFTTQQILFDSERSIVLRCIRNEDSKSVVLKVLHENKINPDEVGRFRHEYNILKNLGGCAVVACYGIGRVQGAPYLILEDCGCESLKSFRPYDGLSLREKLQIAIKISGALGTVHHASIIHKDLNPANILYNSAEGTVKLIDFGIASVLEKEQVLTMTPSHLEGSLQYIAPEQTGRMNRSVDYRSDLYSMGITFYELFVGRVPFDFSDRLKMIHFHIAKNPPAPHEVAAEIPIPVSEVIMKLISKEAENRYRSSWGVRVDLQKCLERLDLGGKISPFEIAERDIPDRFVFPEKLYGTESKVLDLLSSFDRVCNGQKEVVFVKGYSGVGKTSLIKEIYKPITGRRGFFISGKHDLMNRSTPYHGLVSALKDLVMQVLGEDKDRLHSWETRIREAVGINGQLLIDVLPELRQLVDSPSYLDPSESVEVKNNRFNNVFKNFIHVFCRVDHPLVLFLDDLQWADTSTLSFIQDLIRDNKTQYLFLIGSYRDTEIDEGHKINQLISVFDNDGIPIKEIELKPLNTFSIQQLVADGLSCSDSEANQLAVLFKEKTGGNPFFIEQFMKDLISEGYMWFDPKRWQWSWDFQHIQEQNITENVADLLARKIEKLRSDTQNILQLAACIGNRFDSRILLSIADMSLESMVVCLNDGVKSGFIRTIETAGNFLLDSDLIKGSDTGIEFSFCHDRFYQACLEMTPSHKKISMHYKLGHIMLERSRLKSLETDIFAITAQLNRSIRLIQTRSEQLELARLNQIAGNRALTSSAYVNAYNYFQTGISLVGSNGWSECYSLTLQLFCQCAEAALLATNYEDSNRLVGTVMGHANSLLDALPAYRTSVSGAIARGRIKEASLLGTAILRKMGMNIPDIPNKWHVMFVMLRTRYLLGKSFATRMSSIPRKESPPEIKARVEFQISLLPCYYHTHPEMIPILVCDALRNCYTYELDEITGLVLSMYCALICGVGGHYEDAQTLLDTGSNYLQYTENKGYIASSKFTLISFVSHWVNQYGKTLPAMEKAIQDLIQLGHQDLVRWGSSTYCFHSFFSARPLSIVAKDLTSYASLSDKFYGRHCGNEFLGLLSQMVKSLTEGVFSGDISDEHYSASKFYSQRAVSQDVFALFILSFCGMYQKVVSGDFAQAAHFEYLAQKYVYSALGTFYLPVFKFYQFIVISQNFHKYSFFGKIRQRIRLKILLGNMKKWSELCPANHQHRLALMQAEYSRISGDGMTAQKFYEDAGRLARKGSFLNDAGLSYEVAGLSYLASGQRMIAMAYFKKARYYYQRWGAKAKVKQIELRYPDLDVNTGEVSTSTTHSTVSASVIDITTLKKSLVAIAEEKVHSLMIEKIISSAIEFAGAERGVLLLKKDDGEFFVEGDGSVDKIEAQILQSMPIDDIKSLPKPVIHYVKNTGIFLVIGNATVASDSLPGLSVDPYIQEKEVKSLLCMPITTGLKDKGNTVGILYLEHRMASHVFTAERIEILEIICLAAAGRLELSLKAATDGLTGLYNHEYFQNILNKEVSQSKRHLRNLSIVMVDIDHFKSFNDQWGHQVGDLVLKKVANAIQNVCRKSDVVARYGGEEMAIILPETGPDMAEAVSERIRARIESCAAQVDGQFLQVTASLGVASLNESVRDVDTLIKQADQALYQAKDSGRNCTVAYQSKFIND